MSDPIDEKKEDADLVASAGGRNSVTWTAKVRESRPDPHWEPEEAQRPRDYSIPSMEFVFRLTVEPAEGAGREHRYRDKKGEGFVPPEIAAVEVARNLCLHCLAFESGVALAHAFPFVVVEACTRRGRSSGRFTNWGEVEINYVGDGARGESDCYHGQLQRRGTDCHDSRWYQSIKRAARRRGLRMSRRRRK